MAKKIEVVGNYFIMTDTVSGDTEMEYTTKNLQYRDNNSIIYFYYGDKDRIVGKRSGYVLADLVDSTGSAFANQDALLTFLRSNTST